MLDQLILYTGFVVACYAIVANDSIQTLGTFLASNRNRPWWILWGYLMTILLVVLWYGWWKHGGDVSYGRLDKIPAVESASIWYLVAPVALLILTRFAIPVSTTFIILVTFSSKAMGPMMLKSLLGYAVAFGVALLLFLLYSTRVGSRKEEEGALHPGWILLQWVTTGFLWSQWLIQDLANMFVYLPRQVSLPAMLAASLLMLLLYMILLRVKGGSIQQIVTNKSHTYHIRAACAIDFIFAVILFVFKELSNIPMSTTWVFLGLLAGREIGLRHLRTASELPLWKNLGLDLGKATIGILVSLAIALLAQA